MQNLTYSLQDICIRHYAGDKKATEKACLLIADLLSNHEEIPAQLRPITAEFLSAYAKKLNPKRGRPVGAKSKAPGHGLLQALMCHALKYDDNLSSHDVAKRTAEKYDVLTSTVYKNVRRNKEKIDKIMQEGLSQALEYHAIKYDDDLSSHDAAKRIAEKYGVQPSTVVTNVHRYTEKMAEIMRGEANEARLEYEAMMVAREIKENEERPRLVQLGLDPDNYTQVQYLLAVFVDGLLKPKD